VNSQENSSQPLGGSFRDPSGHVFTKNGRILRTVNPSAAPDFEFVRQTRFYQEAVRESRLIEARLVDNEELGEEARQAVYVLEHPALPFVSYPYEWAFSALKTAALFHLDFHLEALEHGITLSDASAYNVQFIGARPIFIDTLSLRRYRSGELWAGHSQFCEQFLNPLLLRSLVGVSHNAWYRGTQEGIPTRELRRMLPWRAKLSRRVLTHVILQDTFQRLAQNKIDAGAVPIQNAQLPLPTFRKLLTDLRKWIAKLQPADRERSLWQDYAHRHSYKSEEVKAKAAFVHQFVADNKLRIVWDIGCNTGDYSVAALQAGAEYVVGFDSDQGVLELAFARARELRLNFHPLFLDLANPTPSQGWAQRERHGLQERATADGLLALALLHHLCIARNVPLAACLRWLVGLAPCGVIEFVPKDDPMVQVLLRFRKDIFPDYTRDRFLATLSSIAHIGRKAAVSATGRLLVEFFRSPNHPRMVRVS